MAKWSIRVDNILNLKKAFGLLFCSSMAGVGASAYASAVRWAVENKVLYNEDKLKFLEKRGITMKNLSSSVAKSNAQITAKKIAKTLNRVVKTGVKAFGTGLKVGAAAALGAAATLGALAACESTPTGYQQNIQIIQGTIVSSFDGPEPISKSVGTFYNVQQIDTNGTKIFYIANQVKDKYPNIKVGSEITFRWDDASRKVGYSSVGDLIQVNNVATK